MLELLWWPLLACLLLTGIHAYLGLHVLARGVIFVDLALAQVAALGMTAALLAGHAPQSTAAYLWALGFTGAAAALLALTPRQERAVPQEAFIGIVYAVAAALTVLVLDRVPQGGEQIKQLLVGSLLAVTAEDVARVAAFYAVIGGLHWLCRRPLLAITAGRRVAGAPWWDFFFYFTFGLVIVSSVRLAGVLLVFSYLVVPAVIGAWVAPTLGRRLAVGWVVGCLASVVGLVVSYRWDLPTGAAVVATFGALLVALALARALVALRRELPRQGAKAAAGLMIPFGVAVTLAGLALAAFPGADHLWLDAIERAVPAIQTVFLTPYERQVAAVSRSAIERGAGELARLRRLQADAQWGTQSLSDDERERLRQFLAGRDEIAAGDRLVLGTLTGKARQRQRWVLGVPLALSGVGLALCGVRWRCRPGGS